MAQQLLPGMELRDERKNKALATLLLRICDLEYWPGTILSETALANEFGISRTPMREVLHYLGFMGLVEPKTGVGTVVTTLTPTEHAQLGHLRLQLADILPKMLDMKGAARVEQQMTSLREDNARLRDAPDFRAFATIGLAIQESVGALICNREFRLIWHQTYYKHARFAYKLMKVDWQRCVLEQDLELVRLIEAFRTRDAAAIGAHYRRTMEGWISFSDEFEA